METAAYLEHRPYLLALAYRMLGSRAEAEDILSEAYLRVHEVNAESPRAYLTRVVTRLCLDRLKSAAVRRETYIGPWLPEPWIDSPEQDFEHKESLEMAFLVMLERLTPAERAAYLLRQVFELDYAEIAETIGATPDNCRQLVHRAGQHLAQRKARHIPPAERVQRLLGSFLQACQQGDLEGLKSLLAEDVVVLSDGGGKVGAATRPVEGADRVARFFLGATTKWPDWAASPQLVTLNGVPALWLGDSAILPEFTEDGRVQNLYVVRNPDKLVSLATTL